MKYKLLLFIIHGKQRSSVGRHTFISLPIGLVRTIEGYTVSSPVNDVGLVHGLHCPPLSEDVKRKKQKF